MSSQYISGAKFATNQELKDKNMLTSQDGSLYLCSSYDDKGKHRYVFETSSNEHILVIAPSRSGKGVGFVIPNLLAWNDSAIIYDPKGELWRGTSGWREQNGHNCIRLSFADVFAKYNPFTEIKADDPELLKKVGQIVNTLEDKTVKTDPFFSYNGKRLLQSIIIYMLIEKKPLTLQGIAYMMSNYDMDTKDKFNFKDLFQRMKNHSDIFIHSEGAYFLECLIADSTFSNFVSNASLMVNIFKETALGKITNSSDVKLVDLADLTKCPTSLYIELPADESILARLKDVVALILNEIIINVVYKTGERIQNSDGSYNKRNILIMIDEFHQLGEFRTLERMLSDGGGYGAKLALITQGDGQIDIAYNYRHSIFTSMNHLIVFRPNDESTAKRICAGLGKVKEKITRVTKFTDENNKTKESEQDNLVERELFNVTDIMTLDNDKCIVFSKGLKILGHKVDFRYDPSLGNLTKLPEAINYNQVFTMEPEIDYKK